MNRRLALKLGLTGLISAIHCNVCLGAGTDLLINPAVTASQETSVRGDDESKALTIRLNVSAGTVMAGQMFLGVKYFSTSVESAYGTGSNDKATTELTGWGPCVGYFGREGFAALLSWLPSPVLKENSGNDQTEYKDGSGYLLDLSWRFKINNSWAAGPQLTYASVTYTTVSENRNDTAIDDGPWKDTSIHPYFGFWLAF